MSSLLSVSSVTVRYWRGHHSVQVLTDVSLELEAGEFCGVWGDRSAGKTTLARVIAGVLAVDHGRVVFDGAVLSDASGLVGRDEVRAQIGFASRTGPILEDLAVEEWIASSLLTSRNPKAARECARLALAEVDAAAVAREPWRNLSDSERMLVAIAQAIVRRPRLVVVDDPVAGLGIVGRAKIMELLRAIADEGVAVLMTAGDAIELRGANRIWALDGGRLTGAPARPLGTVVPLRSAGGQ
jgi:ABC-type multidrug transport system ATPase subunit